LEADVKELRAQLRAAHEVQRVPEEVSRFLATTAEVQLQQPEITGLAVPVAFTLHVPVQRDGECEYEHYGGVLQEEATKETSMLALEMLLKEVFFHVTRRVVLEDDGPCPTNPDLLAAARSSAVCNLHRLMRALTTGSSDVPTEDACADLGVVTRLVLPWTLTQQVCAGALC
jgi:hypothetical protein